MPSTYSASLRTEDIGNGEQTGTWGDTTDRNIGTLLEQAIAGYVAVAFAADADDTLSALNGTSDEARNMVVEVTGALTATRNMVCPTAEKLYFFYNNTTGSQSVVLKTSGGTGITVPNGKKRVLYCDGTNVLDAVTDLASGTTINNVTITTNSGAVTLTNKTIDNTNTVTLKDTLFTLQDDGDTSKQLRLQLSGLATANTGILTLPLFTANAATMVTLDATQTVQNKTFDNTTTFETKDTLFTLQDNTTASKKALFECSGLTGTNTFTFPADGTSTLLTDLRQQSSPANYATAGGTADALTGTYTPAPAALINGQEFRLRAASANATTTPTFTPNSGTITAKIIVKDNNAALAVGDIAGSSHELALRYNSSTDRWHMVGHIPVVVAALAASQSDQETATSTTTYVSPGRQHFHPGSSKAWCCYDNQGSSGTTIVNYNVSSLTDNGVGLATMNFTTSFSSGLGASTGYTATSGASSVAGSVSSWYINKIFDVASAVASSCKIVMGSGDFGASSVSDLNYNAVTLFGDF